MGAGKRMSRRKQTTEVAPVVDDDFVDLPSNAELKQLIEATKTRLENWTVEVERNPNPRMVHVLKNILSHINTFTRITDARMVYSYKSLSHQMATLLQEVAGLNTVIMESLLEDDMISAGEEDRINDALMRVVHAAVELIRIVQQAFIGRRRQIEGTTASPPV